MFSTSWDLNFLAKPVNRRCSKESSIQEQVYEMVDELNMTPGNSRDPSLNKTTLSEADMERRSPEDLDGGGYSSLKSRSSATFAQSSVYAQLHIYANTSTTNN